MVCDYGRSETEKPGGTISSRSRRTSCHPRPYISELVLRPSKGPVHPPTTSPSSLPPPSRRYTGSCDLRRGKLSTLTPRLGEGERVSRVTSDICELFDRQTAVSLFPAPVARSSAFFPPFFLLCDFLLEFVWATS